MPTVAGTIVIVGHRCRIEHHLAIDGFQCHTSRQDHGDALHLRRWLSICRERPCRRAAETRNELAPLHSITSSARATKATGTVSPRIFAVLRLRSRKSLSTTSIVFLIV